MQLLLENKIKVNNDQVLASKKDHLLKKNKFLKETITFIIVYNFFVLFLKGYDFRKLHKKSISKLFKFQICRWLFSPTGTGLLTFHHDFSLEYQLQSTDIHII